MATRTILLIDYDPGSIQSTLGPLVEAGYRVEVVNDGLAGLEAFDRLKPDMVLIEPMVPRKHGFQVCQEIKQSEQGRNTPVLITTGFYRGRKHQLEAREYYGCDGYLEKPIAADLLLSTCEQHFVDGQAGPATAEPSPSGPSDDSVPVLEEMSDDEIMQRLDALIDSPESESAPDSEPVPLATEPPAPEPATVESVDDELDRQLDAITTGADSVAEQVSPVEVPEPTAPAPDVPPSEKPSPPERSSDAAGAPSVATVFELDEPVSPARASIEFDRRSPWLLRGSLIGGAVVLVVAALTFALKGDGESPLDRSIPESSTPIAAPTRPIAPPAVQSDPAETAGTTDSGAPADPFAAGELTAGPPAPSSGAAIDSSPGVEQPTGRSRPQAEARPVQPARSTTPSPRPVVTVPAPANAEPKSEPPAARQVPAEAEPQSPPIEPAAEPVTTEAIPATPTPAPTETSEAASFDPNLIELPVTSIVSDPVSAETAEPFLERPEPQLPTAPARPKARRGQLIPLAEVDTKPRSVERALPAYPALARRMRKQGRVTLEVLVDETGNVAEVQVADGVDRLLDDAARRAARRWTYAPAIKDGVPVRVWIVEDVHFRL